MKRLIKKASSNIITLHSFISQRGTPVVLNARILANKLQYTVELEYQFHTASIYDGSSFETAFDFYIEAMMAFLSLSAAESMKRQKQLMLEKARNLLLEVTNDKVRKQHTVVLKQPLFLGISDPC